MLALDSRLEGKSVFLRESMIKFRESTSTDLEICKAGYKPLPLYLNQQMIKILEDMGVDHQFFMDLQAMEVERLRVTTSSAERASTFLKTSSVGARINLPWFINKLPSLQLSFQNDNFLTDVVEAAVLMELRALKYKARIPVKDGYTLLGIMDETGILEEGQIFCIVEVDGEARVITGKNGKEVIITRSPALHPGDIQLAFAITVPEKSPLMRLRNCICFSQKGPRDLPSKLSGGDLDGDTFHIIFDANAQHQRVLPPADYTRQTPIALDRPVNREDMTDFFVTFMETDQLGRICNAHKILADQSDEGVLDPRCVQLAEMASTAVDFSKTGIPVRSCI
jgi:RNA dependent RNA polymerase